MQGFLQPRVLITRVPTITGSFIQGFYNQRFIHPGVLQPGLYTSRGLATSGSYIEAVLQPDILTTRSLTTKDSYNRGFFHPGVLQEGVLELEVLSTMVS